MSSIVIGIGNEYRRDDGVGLVVAERLRSRVPAGVEVVGCELEPSRLIDAWEGAELALVVDAVHSGAEPGTLHRFDAGEAPVPAAVFRPSTHAFGVGEAVELSRALGTLPARVVLFGVEGEEFAAGEGLTPPVEAAVEPVARAMLEELERVRREERTCTSER